MHSGQKTNESLLGDTPTRNYAQKLLLFNAFAGPELRRVVATLGLKPGMCILDAGCGTGETLNFLHDAIGQEGLVVGIDLAEAHTQAARIAAPADVIVIQADLQKLPLVPRIFDLIWSTNTINHLSTADAALQGLITLLRPAGTIILGQSSLLPDMYFAWDARLERLTNEAVRHYFRDRYGLGERDLTGARGILGSVRRAKLKRVSVHTVVIERIFPLDAATETYIGEVILRRAWGERLRSYMSAADCNELARLCDPSNPEFALRRDDFHFLQTLTLVSGSLD
jgi:SAM-dependent methyltransferase